MFFLKKLITYLILPPGVFILVFIGSGLYLFKRRRRIGYLLIFSGVCLYAFSIGPAKDALISPLENAFRLETGASGDVIVILGSGIESEALSRLMCGHRLWKELHVPLILTGSGEGTDVPPEGRRAGRGLRSDVGGREGTDVRSHPGEIRFAVVNEFHRAGRSGVGDRILGKGQQILFESKKEKMRWFLSCFLYQFRYNIFYDKSRRKATCMVG